MKMTSKKDLKIAITLLKTSAPEGGEIDFCRFWVFFALPLVPLTLQGTPKGLPKVTQKLPKAFQRVPKGQIGFQKSA